MQFRFALLFALASNVLHAQPFNWQWSVRDTASLGAPDMLGFATDALGNSYVTGTFYGTVTFGNLPDMTSAGQSDVFVVKYNNQGVAQWAVRAGGSDFDYPNALAIDSSGGVWITGAIESGTAIFGSTTLPLTGAMDVFVAKLNATDGSWLWAKRFGSGDFQADHREWGKAIACDAEGNAYVSGCFVYSLAVPGLTQLDGCSQYYNSFLMKLDPNGNGIWSRRPDCGHQWIYSASEGQQLTVGHDGMLYAGFRARGDTIFYETDTLLNSWTGAGTHEGVVAKYDPDGNYHWSRVIGGYGYDDVQGLAADAEGHVYIAMHRETDYDLGVVGIEIAGNQGYYKNVILKTDAAGNFIWGTRLGNSTYDHDIEAMVLEAPDKLLVGGWHQGNFEIGGITPNPGVSGSYGYYLARFDSSSALTDLMAQRYTYPRRGLGLGRDEGGNIYIGGAFQDSLHLPGLAPMGLVNASAGAMFLARSGDFPTSVVRASTSSGIALFPSPSDGRFTISSTEEISGIRLIDAQGRVVQAESFQPTKQRAVATQASGILICDVIRANGDVVRSRIMIVR